MDTRAGPLLPTKPANLVLFVGNFALDLAAAGLPLPTKPANLVLFVGNFALDDFLRIQLSLRKVNYNNFHRFLVRI